MPTQKLTPSQLQAHRARQERLKRIAETARTRGVVDPEAQLPRRYSPTKAPFSTNPQELLKSAGVPVERFFEPQALVVPEISDTEMLRSPQIILTARRIQEFVASTYKISVEQLAAPDSLTKEASYVCQIAMYLAREIPTPQGRRRTNEDVARSFPQGLFSGSSVNYACEQLKKHMSKDPTLAKRVDELKQMLLSLMGQGPSKMSGNDT